MAISIQAQILDHLIELKEDVAEIKAIVPTVKELNQITRVGNGTKPLTTRMRDVEDYIDCQKEEKKEKKEKSSKFNWILVTALVGNTIGIIFALFK